MNVSQLRIAKIVQAVDAVYRELARLSVNRLRGTRSALNPSDILEAHPISHQAQTLAFLRDKLALISDAEEAERIERLLIANMELAIEERTASLSDMLTFYVERGRMIIGDTKVPALEVVPWLQAQTDFAKREEMLKENSIFLKGIMNPIMLAVLELTVRAVKEQFGFDNYAQFCEARKQVSFSRQAEVFQQYLADTTDTYYGLVSGWVEEKIGRPLDGLSRYHALHLLRITRFDDAFPASRLRQTVTESFKGLSFDPWSHPGVVTDVSDHPAKNPNGICIAVDVPGEIHVLMKPVGGLIDVETLLHETGHAFFLSSVRPDLPMEYRRIYRSPALDEAFAFLFMDLIDNEEWLSDVAGLAPDRAGGLVRLTRTKRLCLIRRHIGKFLAEKELHESGDIKDPEPYCRHLGNATGFTYEPQGYLIDMQSDFYALDYLAAWSGAHVLREFLEDQWGLGWFRRGEAGVFLREVAASGRRESLEASLIRFCGRSPRLPDFRDAA